MGRRSYVERVPVPSGPAVAAGRTAWRYCPPASPGGSSFMGPSSAPFGAQSTSRVVEDGALRWGEALEPLERDLVEHAVELVRPLATHASRGCRHRTSRRPLLLR